MNCNITKYNALVDDMLHMNFPDVRYQGIYSFLDNQGLLSSKFVRPNDTIHLGSKGIAKLVSYMKVCIFNREKYDEHYVHPKQMQKSTQKVGSPEPT